MRFADNPGVGDEKRVSITYPREIRFRLRSIFATWNTSSLNGVRFSRTIFSLAPSGALEMIIKSVLVRRPDLENHEQGDYMANQNIAFHQPADTGLLNIPTLLHRVRILWEQFGALALGRKRLSNRSFRREACAVTWLDNEKQRCRRPGDTLHNVIALSWWAPRQGETTCRH